MSAARLKMALSDLLHAGLLASLLASAGCSAPCTGGYAAGGQMCLMQWSNCEGHTYAVSCGPWSSPCFCNVDGADAGTFIFKDAGFNVGEDLCPPRAPNGYQVVAAACGWKAPLSQPQQCPNNVCSP